MKKFAFVLVAGLFLAMAASSCKSSKDCPAYSQVEVKHITEKA